jgi:hypothetical protein
LTEIEQEFIPQLCCVDRGDHGLGLFLYFPKGTNPAHPDFSEVLWQTFCVRKFAHSCLDTFQKGTALFSGVGRPSRLRSGLR